MTGLAIVGIITVVLIYLLMGAIILGGAMALSVTSGKKDSGFKLFVMWIFWPLMPFIDRNCGP